MQRPEQNHGHHAGQEQDDNERVEDGKPLDVGAGHGFQQVVPSRGPLGERIVLRKREIVNISFRNLY